MIGAVRKRPPSSEPFGGLFLGECTKSSVQGAQRSVTANVLSSTPCATCNYFQSYISIQHNAPPQHSCACVPGTTHTFNFLVTPSFHFVESSVVFEIFCWVHFWYTGNNELNCFLKGSRAQGSLPPPPPFQFHCVLTVCFMTGRIGS